MIPKEYYDALHIGEEVMIELHEGKLVIKPIFKVDEDFAENCTVFHKELTRFEQSLFKTGSFNFT
ncbi:hypothetical protein GCM10011384_44120 [Psychrobacillus lasiicapitis]|nr:hypothetical protein GCM10011384_44120 [Psychrobacillus lasiicapitis]